MAMQNILNLNHILTMSIAVREDWIYHIDINNVFLNRLYVFLLDDSLKMYNTYMSWSIKASEKFIQRLDLLIGLLSQRDCLLSLGTLQRSGQCFQFQS